MQRSFLPFTSALSGASSPSRFVAIYTDAPDGGHFLGLTPKIMRWTDNTYLLDLSPVLHYWSHLAEQHDVSFIEYISSILSTDLSSESTAESSAEPSAEASREPLVRTPCFVFATHPWQALLLLSVAIERPTLNFIEAQSHLGRRILHDITWAQWLTRCHELREHLSAAACETSDHDSGYASQSHPSHQRKSKSQSKSGLKAYGSLSMLTKTIARMQLTLITQMSDIDTAAMHRRFGKLAATAWGWTWPKAASTPQAESGKTRPPSAEQQNHAAGTPRSLFDQGACLDDTGSTATHHQKPLLREGQDNDLFLSDFPWKSIAPTESPSVTRHIETPLRQWDYIESLLREDFDKICGLACWNSNERVVSLEWVLSFSCSPCLPIPVLFRHPHSLHRESGHHKTALLQAFHSWQKATQQRLSPEVLGDTYITDDTITDWTLTIKERMVMAPIMRSIFRDDLSSDSSQLLRIENSIAVPLIGYAMTDHWCPEKSFVPESKEFPSEAGGNLAKFATHQRRPLFVLDQPETIANKHQSSGLIFCERVSTTWWSDEPSDKAGTSRDYYIRMTDDGLLQWVFQNDDGTLKLHGLFG